MKVGVAAYVLAYSDASTARRGPSRVDRLRAKEAFLGTELTSWGHEGDNCGLSSVTRLQCIRGGYRSRCATSWYPSVDQTVAYRHLAPTHGTSSAQIPEAERSHRPSLPAWSGATLMSGPWQRYFSTPGRRLGPPSASSIWPTQSHAQSAVDVLGWVSRLGAVDELGEAGRR